LDTDPPDYADVETSPDGDDVTAAGTKRAPLRCWFAKWGVKTHKSGKQSSYFGYALHVLMRVPDVIKGDSKAADTDKLREPLLIEAFAITSASTDVVDVTLGLIKTIIARGGKVIDLMGDRHYSHKEFQRWVRRLWQLGVRQVLDLRTDNHGVTDYDGATIVDGTPHCSIPPHLLLIDRPGLGSTVEQREKFAELIAERQKYAHQRRKTAWSRNDGKPGGDGTTRWTCAAAAGNVGCPRIPDSIQAAKESGSPIITPPAAMLSWCDGGVHTIKPGAYMKLHQEEYWGSQPWLIRWNRRTYIEGGFGNLKNYSTGNMHRGFMCVTGRALVTLAITAAVIAYNLRELEYWHIRASDDQAKHPDNDANPLLAMYAQHPLHQPTVWQHGFTMLTAQDQATLDHEWMASTPEDDDLPDAA
jgi:hypothetical protein